MKILGTIILAITIAVCIPAFVAIAAAVHFSKVTNNDHE